MKKTGFKFIGFILLIISISLITVLFLVNGDILAERYDVIGIRIATLFIAFLSLFSTSFFSFMILRHNLTMRSINESTEKRAEMFRSLTFASSNYSIVEFKESMTIYKESSRYINKYVLQKSLKFHMIADDIDVDDVFENPKSYHYVTLKIPYDVVEGKMVGNLVFDSIKFERDGTEYKFITPPCENEVFAFLLYNDSAQNREAIINMIYKKDSDFFSFHKINSFGKIKLRVRITSLLGVEVKGISELYFTNPENKESGGINTFKINSSNFFVTELPTFNNYSDSIMSDNSETIKKDKPNKKKPYRKKSQAER